MIWSAQMARRTRADLTLTGFEFPLCLVDDVDPSTAAHEAVRTMARQQRFQRVLNFHDPIGLLAVWPCQMHLDGPGLNRRH